MLASTLESQRVFFQESLLEMESNASGVLERKAKQIHNLESSLLHLDTQVEGQLVTLDGAREAHENARADFASSLTK